MKKDKFTKVQEAAQFFGLSEQATLEQIKKAYREKCKLHHPDITGSESKEAKNDIKMDEIISAYQVLIEYCQNYSFPLEPDPNQPKDAEDWWMDRFGHDPLWGRPKERNKKK
jgi:hypothetical protein